MKVAIIGAGASGLCTLKQCLDQGLECEVFEKNDVVGGLWNYTDSTESDENGVPLHSCMYQGLRTNLPKETIEFENYPNPECYESYVNQPYVLAYLQNYAKDMDLHKYIKFRTQVINVEPHDQGKWKVQVKNMSDGRKETKIFDSVMVANGHNFKPRYPQIKNLDKFTGNCIHSAFYRSPDVFENKRVIVVGAGPSGVDVAEKLLQKAKKVFLSRRGVSLRGQKIAEGVVQKPVISNLEKNCLIFQDGSEEIVDDIILCTGFVFYFPFLHPSCKIEVDDNWVKYLYENVVNAYYPTMFFIGIPNFIANFPVFEHQAKYAISVLKGKCKIPETEVILKQLHEIRRKRANEPNAGMHRIGVDHREYVNRLSDTGSFERMPDVMNKLYYRVMANRNVKDRFKVLDSENFIEL